MIGALTALVGVVLGVQVHAAVSASGRAVASVSMRWSPAATDVNALLAHLVDQETGERGYLLTGRSSYLQPYRVGERLSARDVATLRRLLAGDADATRRLGAVQRDIARWRALVAAPEIAARQRSAAAAVALASAGAGKQQFDRLRADVAKLQQVIETRRDLAQHRVQVDNREVGTWLWVTVGVSVALGLGVLLGLALWVLRPVRRLSSSVRRVSDGELDAPIVVSGPPEIADAARNADAMRRRILHELERSESARQALEQRGPVVVALSQQLAARTTAPVAGLRYAAQLRPAEGLLAGDWVDVMPLGHDRVALMLLDVSGHGAAAGIEALRLKTVLTTALSAGRHPHEALALAAAGFTEDERFATAVVMVLDTVTGQLRWANAGHLPPRIVPLDEAVLDPEDLAALRPTGPLLSSLTGGWVTKSTRLEVGQMLLTFSDGLTEARDAQGRQFGVEGVAAALSQATVRDVDTAVSVCLAAVLAHAVDVHRDDITLLAVSRDPTSIVPATQPAPHHVGGHD